VARFVVAPPGYGKSTLAVEYAETMFGFSHVFWLSGASPCFVRDLDAGTIAADCLALDPKAALVVIDDLPLLDTGRIESFSAQVDGLLESGCEVIVNCTPANDVLQGIQPDSVRLGPRDLLLDDSELDIARTKDEQMRNPAASCGPDKRVAALAWPSSDDAPACFARACFDEDLPSDVRIALGSLLILGNGSLGMLDRIAPGVAQVCGQIAESYPHCGIDVQEACFSAPSIPADDLVTAYGKRLTDMARWVEGLDGATLALCWADVLVDSGNAARACDVVRCFSHRNDRALWLYRRSYDLVRSGCAFSTLKAIRSINGRRFPNREAIELLESVCLALLGDTQDSLKICKRLAFGNVEGRLKVAATVLLVRFSGAEFRMRALEELAQTDLDVLDNQVEPDRFWEVLAYGCLALRGGFARLAKYVEDAMNEPGEFAQDAVALLASWMYRFACAQVVDGASWESNGLQIPSALEHVIRARLVETDAANYYVASAALSMEQAHMKGMSLVEGPLPVRLSLVLRSVELGIVEQRRSFGQFEANEERAYNVRVATHPDTFADLARATSPRADDLAYPQVAVRLFGRFDISLGGRRIDSSRFRRRKAKTMLAILVIEGGREITRERLVESLWPGSEPASSNKNYYALLSQLRHALRLPDGTCPYILSHRRGVSIDERLVVSDLGRMNEICRTFLFDEPDPEGWAELFREIDRDFPGDMLPTERDNDFIIQARVDARNRLVDALVAATGRISDAGYPEWGIWFARSAISRDNTREDGYAALMRAQVASGQRTAALSTYLDCRRVLDRELGVEPSAELSELYQQILCEDGKPVRQKKRSR